ncbi:hypothetical protein GCM10009799_20660 [Nocardiopsis rhodophaea]|uniref:Minor tail protein n=1 Tax=Nocardiopsis rhodophaea TaxID=280238 RepID=A0ABP5EC26_9ACTN
MTDILAHESGVTGLQQHRRLISSLLAGLDSGSTLARRSGLLWTGQDPALLTGDDGAMTATVSPWTGIVQGAASDVQGAYLANMPDPKTLTFADGDAGAARYDWVVARVRDDVEDASGFTDADVVIVPGDASGPTVPAGVSYMVLWRVEVPADASAGNGGIPWGSAVTDYRTYTSAFGGATPVPDIAARNRLTDVRDGQLVHVWSLDTLYMRVLSSWDPIAGSGFVDALNATYQPLPGAWTAVPDGTDYTSTLRWRREGDTVRLDGSLVSTRADTPYWDLDSTISGLALPSDARPAATTAFAIGGQQSDSSSTRSPVVRATISASAGTIYLRAVGQSTYIAQQLDFSGITYVAGT